MKGGEIMERMIYEAPAFELLAFQAEDVIRTSGKERYLVETQMDRSMGTPIDTNA